MTDSVGRPRSSFRARPYAITGGRTRPSIELGIDAMVVAGPESVRSQHGHEHRSEHRRIIALCYRPAALAEVAGRLGRPLQVVMVLVADLLDDHTLQQLEGFGAEDHQDLQLLEKVLTGLQSLPAEAA